MLLQKHQHHILILNKFESLSSTKIPKRLTLTLEWLFQKLAKSRQISFAILIFNHPYKKQLFRNLIKCLFFLVILTKNVLKLSLKHFIMIFAGTDKFEVDPRSGEVRVVQPIDREDRDEGFNVNGEIRLTVTIQVEQSTYLKLNFLCCKEMGAS